MWLIHTLTIQALRITETTSINLPMHINILVNIALKSPAYLLRGAAFDMLLAVEPEPLVEVLSSQIYGHLFQDLCNTNFGFSKPGQDSVAVKILAFLSRNMGVQNEQLLLKFMENETEQRSCIRISFVAQAICLIGYESAKKIKPLFPKFVQMVTEGSHLKPGPRQEQDPKTVMDALQVAAKAQAIPETVLSEALECLFADGPREVKVAALHLVSVALEERSEVEVREKRIWNLKRETET